MYAILKNINSQFYFLLIIQLSIQMFSGGFGGFGGFPGFGGMGGMQGEDDSAQ